MTSIEIAVVGIHHRVTPATRHKITRELNGGPMKALLEREPGNVHDENAIKVILDEPSYKGLHIGYLQREVAKVYAGPMDRGEIVDFKVWLTDIEVDELGAGEGRLAVRFNKKRKKKSAKKKAKR